MNSFLSNDEVQNIIWKQFNLDLKYRLPVFGSSMLYGSISEIIHSPTIRDIIVSDESPEEYRFFFNELAKYYQINFVVFDEILASGGEDLLASRK